MYPPKFVVRQFPTFILPYFAYSINMTSSSAHDDWNLSSVQYSFISKTKRTSRRQQAITDEK